jgi:hypothetical protein
MHFVRILLNNYQSSSNGLVWIMENLAFLWERTVGKEVTEERDRRLSQIVLLPQPIRRFENLRLILWECGVFYEITNNIYTLQIQEYPAILPDISSSSSSSSFSHHDSHDESSSLSSSLNEDEDRMRANFNFNFVGIHYYNS